MKISEPPHRQTFVAFNDVGLIPLLPFVALYFVGSSALSNDAFVSSVIFTAAAFFLIDAVMGRVVKKDLVKSGLLTRMVGCIAAAVAYAIGYLLNLVV